MGGQACHNIEEDFGPQTQILNADALIVSVNGRQFLARQQRRSEAVGLSTGSPVGVRIREPG